MTQNTVYSTQTLYFTEKLKARLNAIPNFKLTVLEAPMGYGKTTAVRFALEKTKLKVLWHTVYAGGVPFFWGGFCKALAPLSADLADRLQKLGLPTDVVLVQKAVELISDADFTEETVLVIDDYHFVDSPVVDRFMAFLLANIPKKLRIVIMSRTAFLSGEETMQQLRDVANYIRTEFFLLKPSDIHKYYALCGIKITPDEEKRLFKYSEGWITPLYVSMLEYREHGRFLTSGSISALMQRTVYNSLRSQVKEFLNSVCLFDSFSLEQALYMQPDGDAARLLDELLRKNSFISKDALTGHYSFHNLFITHPRDVFDRQEPAKKNQLLERAGFWHLKNREYIQAMSYFERAGNFNLILAALTKEWGATITGEHKAKIIEYFDLCRKELNAQNLKAVLVFMRFMISYKEIERLKEACRVFEENIDMFEGTHEEKNYLMVEYERFSSLMKYNNIMEMSKHHRKALSYMGAHLGNEESVGNWTFGSPSVLLMFYRESGKLAEHVEDMKECMPFYYKITNGHGSGAEYVMEAEAALNAGEFEKAETIIHKGLHYAQEKNQWSMLLAAVFVEIRLAVIRGDYYQAVFLKNQLFDLMESKKQYLLLHTLDMCESYIYLLLNMPEKTAKWIQDGDFSNTRLMFPALPNLHIVYGRYLLLTEDYRKLIGMADVFLKVASIYPNLLAAIYTNIYLAAAYWRIGMKKEAKEKLKEALDMAVVDNVYLPFAENGNYIANLLKQFAAEEQYENHIKQIVALYKKSDLGIKKIEKEHFSEEKISLTTRESEVAYLAAAGMSNKDIANSLMISENTVKSRLKLVFEKLGVKSRAQLNDKQRTNLS
jgi:LuxR family maltose regulon positive regulatory protein